MPSSSEGSRVWRPTTSAIAWSIDWPTRMSAPPVFFGWAHVRYVAALRAWSPAPSPSERALFWARPETKSRSSRNGSQLSSEAGILYFTPVRVGFHCGMIAPFGKNTNADLTGGL